MRVNCVAPGAIYTDMNNGMTEKDWDLFNESVPLRRAGRAIEVAKCINMLIENEYITGQVISPNGGYVM